LNSEIYELVALTARYIFVLIMLWIVWRALRGTLIDSRRAAKLRRLSPMTGVIGEFVVTRGDGKARAGMRYPVIREGFIGSSRQADVRIRHGSVRRRHAYFQLTKEGLSLRGHAGARLRFRGSALRSLTMTDGLRVTIGSVELLLVLTMPGEYSSAVRAGYSGFPDETDPLFDTGDWDDDFDAVRAVRHVTCPEDNSAEFSRSSSAAFDIDADSLLAADDLPHARQNRETASPGAPQADRGADGYARTRYTEGRWND